MLPSAPEPPESASPSEPSTGPLAAPEAGAEPPEQRSATALTVLTVLVNLAFLLLVVPVSGLSALNTDISSFNAQEVDGGWFLFWPGMLIAWGAAWAGFAVCAARKRIRAALMVFLLIAGAWILPITAYILSLLLEA